MAVTWQRQFFTIWFGQAASLFGSSLASFALVWWITRETGSATVLAIGTLLTMVPGIVLGPLAGALVDRWDRRWIMVAADACGALVALVLALSFAFDSVAVWQIYAAMVLRSLAGAFHGPAFQASTALLVPDDQLTRVGGLNALLQGASAIVAPALAALLITLLPLSAMMLIDVATALLAVATLLVVRIPRPAATPREARPSVLGEMFAGLGYIWRWRGLRAVMVCATLLNMVLTPAFALLPILATGHFAGGSGELAALQAAEGAGIVLGGLVLSVWGGFRRKIFTALLGLAGLALGTLLVGVAPGDGLVLALAGMLLMGMAAALANAPFMAIIQSVVAPALQGRVLTVLGSVTMGMAPLALLLAGPLADRIGVQSWYLAGAGTAAVLAAYCWADPAVRQIEDHQP